MSRRRRRAAAREHRLQRGRFRRTAGSRQSVGRRHSCGPRADALARQCRSAKLPASRIRCCWSVPPAFAAYDAALAAMKSWGSEFGYELINADWQLKYPPPDPNLAKSVAQAVFLARQEHARLIAAAPSKYGKRPRIGSYRSPTGGEAGGQGGAGEGESPGFYSSKPSDRYGRDYAGGGSSATRSGQRAARPAAALAAAAKAAVAAEPAAVTAAAGWAQRRRRVRRQQSLRIASPPGMAGSPSMNPGGMGTVRGMDQETAWVARRDRASPAAWSVRRA